MIYTVTLNPALDKTVQIPSFRLGEVNRISAMRTDPGGKGINVSKVLRELGEPSVAAAILGGAAGRKIESALRALGIEGMYLFTGHETRTNLKIVDPTLHTNTDVNEPGAPADEAVLSKLLTQLTDRLRPGDLVVLSGKAPRARRIRSTATGSWPAAPPVRPCISTPRASCCGRASRPVPRSSSPTRRSSPA